MFKLIDNLITSSAIELKELEVKKESVDIVQTISWILSQYDTISKKKSIQTHPKSEAPDSANYQPAQLKIKVPQVWIFMLLRN